MPDILVSFGKTWSPAPYVLDVFQTANGLRIGCNARTVRAAKKEASLAGSRWQVDGKEYYAVRLETWGFGGVERIDVYVIEEKETR